MAAIINNTVGHKAAHVDKTNTTATQSLPNVLMIGTGEYTTGWVHGQPSNSDKAAGIIALTIFDLRSRGLCGQKIGLCGVNGSKFPALRAHMQQYIGDRYALDVSCSTYPADNVTDEHAYKQAIQDFAPGDVVIITTPDQTHFTIACEATRHGLHALIAKPIVKTLAEQYQLISLTQQHHTLCAGEFHKRWDPLYSDAHSRIANNIIGPVTYFHAYMSQPKHQLKTFAAWAKNKHNSDISYYLNAHHIDFLTHATTESKGKNKSRPVKVTAMSATGYANQYLKDGSSSSGGGTTSSDAGGYDIEDSITLTVQMLNADGSLGVASFTSSWTAPASDTHTQQHFHYLGHKGEIYIDQAHRGYNSAVDNAGYATHNPLFFRYTPDAQGHFAGQSCYGYASFQHFIEQATLFNAHRGSDAVLEDKHGLALLDSEACLYVTAILEAGRRSLDQGKAIEIVYEADAAGAKVPRIRLQ